MGLPRYLKEKEKELKEPLLYALGILVNELNNYNYLLYVSSTGIANLAGLPSDLNTRKELHKATIRGFLKEKYYGNLKKKPINFNFRMSQDANDRDMRIDSNEKIKAMYRKEIPIELDKKRNFSYKDKRIIFKRDNYTCKVCGITQSEASKKGYDLHADHIFPHSKGGKTLIENAQTLCQKCNIKKGNKHE